MNTEHLIQMANQIAQYHEAFPEHAEAIEGIYTHLRRFWEPRMRRELLAHLDGGAVGMTAVVVETLRVHRAELTPAAAVR